MTSDEFLARIDQHMARGNELMEQVRSEMALNRASYEHELQLTRSVVERDRRAFEHMFDALVEVRDDLRELKAETRAHTEAIFRVLDRFDSGGAQAAGA